MTDLTPEAVKAALEGATPGPWVIGSAEGRVLSHWEGIGYWEIAKATITDFRGYSGTAYFAGGTQEANAHLIAMAPDLAREYLRLKEVEKAGKELSRAAGDVRAILRGAGVRAGSLNKAIAAFHAAVEGK